MFLPLTQYNVEESVSYVVATGIAFPLLRSRLTATLVMLLPNMPGLATKLSSLTAS